MSYTVVIIDSPSKVNKIQKYLGKKYVVVSCNGFGYTDEYYKRMQKRGLLLDFVKPSEEYYECILNKIDLLIQNSNNVNVLFGLDEYYDDDTVDHGNIQIIELMNRLNIRNKICKRIRFNAITSDDILNSIKNAENIII